VGESQKQGLGLGFDGSIRLEFHGATVSSDAGLLVYRDLDEALGLTVLAGSMLSDVRTGLNFRHSPSLTALLRQSIYGRLAGYDDLNDANRLAVDPVMRQVVDGRAVEKAAASRGGSRHAKINGWPEVLGLQCPKGTEPGDQEAIWEIPA
jgi:hypothetical protein